MVFPLKSRDLMTEMMAFINLSLPLCMYKLVQIL